ncbi:hypothetical protein FRX31_026692 [Thalictrum thalictroides]|uniref:Transmembrane protein n=1 Tax=Thalictrum thalictroides TaxID=46969 RepID=A0A7J6VG98_THATH|nr:hypothetical protein FRX31_026692 [Thalictrum thalictroides]
MGCIFTCVRTGEINGDVEMNLNVNTTHGMNQSNDGALAHHHVNHGGNEPDLQGIEVTDGSGNFTELVNINGENDEEVVMSSSIMVMIKVVVVMISTIGMIYLLLLRMKAD